MNNFVKNLIKFDSKTIEPQPLTVGDVRMIEDYRYNLRQEMLKMSDLDKLRAHQEIKEFENYLTNFK